MSTSTSDTTIWESRSGPIVEIDASVIDKIRQSAVDGFNAFGHGGLEIGGVLYGRLEGNHVTVASFAELHCEHARGPGFLLSDADDVRLAALKQPKDDLVPIGWYRSHTRRDLQLDDADRDLFARHFPERNSLALILKPTPWGPASAAVYVRDATGAIVPEAPNEFSIEPPTNAVRGTEPDGSPAEPDSERSGLPDRIETSNSSDPKPRRQHRLFFAPLVLCGLLAPAALFWWLKPSETTGLRVSATTPGEIRIEWSRRSRPVIEAASGELQIRDGEFSTTIPLDSERIRLSTFMYTQRSPLVSVRLQIVSRRPGAAPTEESIEFVGPPTRPASSQPLPRIEPTVRVQVDPVPELPPAGVQVEPAPELPTVAKPASPPPGGSAPQSLVGSAPQRPVVGPPQLRRNPIALPPPRSPVVTSMALPSEPVVSPSTAAPLPDFLSGTRLRAPTLTTPPLTSTATARAATAPAPAAYVGPESGRLIWTGVLGRRGVVEIDESRASIGALAGVLPGIPISLQISPAEFSHTGLIAYTADPRRQGRSEPPSRFTGWNALRFEFDAARAGEVVILERPNPSNGFKRIVLRSDARACSLIVVDWTIQR